MVARNRLQAKKHKARDGSGVPQSPKTKAPRVSKTDLEIAEREKAPPVRC
eukprot:SAG31_NODE_9565_length_1258_cov_1.321829_2_plen_49_part_01